MYQEKKKFIVKFGMHSDALQSYGEVELFENILSYILHRFVSDRVPTDTGKPGKMRQLFPVREKSGNFEKLSKSQGKVREF